jgi:hypothetical protein
MHFEVANRETLISGEQLSSQQRKRPGTIGGPAHRGSAYRGFRGCENFALQTCEPRNPDKRYGGGHVV